MSQAQWMWQDDASGGVMGVIVDFDEDRVQWLEEPGCACTDSAHEQTIADFLQNGARAIMPPADVLEEMRESLANKS